FVPSAADGTGAAPAGVVPLIRNAQFYRVVSSTDNGAGGVDIELDTPLRQDTGLPFGGTALPPTFRRFIYLNGSAEVFVRQLALDL
ncbi:MAG TPA: hypothetical protein VH092_20770, partial [Urbifossiella sp.]|nr:hypothetical protein [Urbifossiella sp.]